jgi:hypothetical protein
MQAVQVAPMSLGVSSAASTAAVTSTKAIYATAVAAEEDSEQWQVELSPGVWTDFPIATMRMLSSALVAGATSLSLCARGRDYIIDLILLVQHNVATGTERKIRRLEVPRGTISMPANEQSREAAA